jgi:hypothetical protein
VWVRQAK